MLSTKNENIEMAEFQEVSKSKVEKKEVFIAIIILILRTCAKGTGFNATLPSSYLQVYHSPAFYIIYPCLNAVLGRRFTPILEMDIALGYLFC